MTGESRTRTRLFLAFMTGMLILVQSWVGTVVLTKYIEQEMWDNLPTTKDRGLPHPSATLGPTRIIGTNWSVAAAQWWCSGSGSEEDPYIIEDLEFDGQNELYGLQIEDSSAYFIIRNCTFINIGSDGSAHAGIEMRNSYNGVLRNNTFTGNLPGNTGIFLSESCSNTIENNTVTDMYYGILFLTACSDNLVQGNEFYSIVTGIHSEGGYGSDFNDGNIFLGNVVNDSTQDGIYLRYSPYSVVQSNFVNNSDYCGIRFSYYADQNLIINNTVDESGIDGITISCFAFNSIITQNIVLDSTRYGISLENIGSYHPSYTQIFKNFISGSGTANGYEYASAVNNQWNTTSGGNYWGDHQVADGDGDGIADTTYDIAGKAAAIDFLPVVGDPFFDGGPIYINGTGNNGHKWEWIASRFWGNGTGTLNDPFLIKDIEINAQNASTGIKIWSSSAHYRLENCTIYNSSAINIGQDNAGILLWAAHNGTFVNCTLHSNGLYGPNTAYGIRCYYSNYTTLQNNWVYGNSGTGISMQNCHHASLESNVLELNERYGLESNGNDNGTLIDNIFRDNGLDLNDHGAYFTDSESWNVTKNTFVDNLGYGVYMHYRNYYNLFYANNFSQNGWVYPVYEYNYTFSPYTVHNINWWNMTTGGNCWDGYNGPDDDDDGFGDIDYPVYGDGPGIDEMPLQDDGFNGSAIHIDDTSTNNWAWAKTRVWLHGEGTPEDPYIIWDIKVDAMNQSSGIHIENSDVQVIIHGVTVLNASNASVPDAAIRLSNTNNTLLLQNNLTENAGHGVTLENGCTNVTISTCNITSSNRSIFLNTCDLTTIEHNTIKNNSVGVYLVDGATNTTIRENTVGNNSFGLHINGANAENATVEGNTIANSTNRGIYIQSGRWHLVSGNTFRNNILHATDDGTANDWDNTTHGNYWDDYDGYDVDGNGRGETSYLIDGGAGTHDSYPLWTIPDTTAPLVSILTPGVNLLCNATNPDFELEIVEYQISARWYTIDGGLTNISFGGTSGVIEVANWTARTNGTVTITFFVNDTTGHLTQESVVVHKDIEAPLLQTESPGTGSYHSSAPSFTISLQEANIHKRWYTLDGGITNRTFTGLTEEIDPTIWANLGEGTRTLVIYANDSNGNWRSRSITVTKDTVAPVVAFVKPETNDEFSGTPSFELRITEANLETAWYTIDGGSTNFTFTGTVGTINQTAWDALDIGEITIRVYVRDKAGHQTSTDRIIKKIAPPLEGDDEPDNTDDGGLPWWLQAAFTGIISTFVGLTIRFAIKSAKKARLSRSTTPPVPDQNLGKVLKAKKKPGSGE